MAKEDPKITFTRKEFEFVRKSFDEKGLPIGTFGNIFVEAIKPVQKSGDGKVVLLHLKKLVDAEMAQKEEEQIAQNETPQKPNLISAEDLKNQARDRFNLKIK